MDDHNEYSIFSEFKSHKDTAELTPFDCEMEDDIVSGFDFQDMAYCIDICSHHSDAMINRCSLHKDLYIDIPTVDEFLYTEGIENRDDSYCECVNYREIETFKDNSSIIEAQKYTCELCTQDMDFDGRIVSFCSKLGQYNIQKHRNFINEEYMGSSHQAAFGMFEGHSDPKASQYCCDSLRLKLDNKYNELKLDATNTISNMLKEIDQEFIHLTQKFNFSEEASIVFGLVVDGKLTWSSFGKSTTLLVKNSSVIELSSRSNYSELEEFMRLDNERSCDFSLFESNDLYCINQNMFLKPYNEKKYNHKISNEPEIQSFALSSSDRYLVITSNEMYSTGFDQDHAIQYITHCVNNDLNKEQIKNGLINEAIQNGSTGNITVMVIDLYELYNEYLKSCGPQSKQISYNPFTSGSRSFCNDISPFINRENSSLSTDISIMTASTTKKKPSMAFHKAVSDEPKLLNKLNTGSNPTFSSINIKNTVENSHKFEFNKPIPAQNDCKNKSMYIRQMTRSKKNKEAKKFDFSGF